MSIYEIAKNTDTDLPLWFIIIITICATGTLICFIIIAINWIKKNRADIKFKLKKKQDEERKNETNNHNQRKEYERKV